MAVEITMPKLGLTMASGTIARWHKRAGEAVRAGEPLLEVATDKITYEVEAPASGVLARVAGGEGDEYACGAVLAVIAAAGEMDTPVAAPVARPAPPPATAAPPAHASRRNGSNRIVASPAARRLARERGVGIGDVRGTGPRGRITLTDVHAHRETSSPAAPATTAFPADLPAQRRAIFRKMTEVAHLPLAQVETTAVVDATAALLARREVGWTAFAVYAAARLLVRHPELRTDASSGRPFDAIDVGLAADTPRGLIVPVVRGADRLDLAATQREIVRLAGHARDGTLAPDDLGGACFSISNVGPQRVERVSPLPDPPQTAILGMGAATLRPAVVDGAVVAARVLDLIVSFDHRFVDGAPAARFLAELAAAFADPAALL